MLILGAMEENRERVLRESREADTLAMDSDWELKKKELLALKRPQAIVDEPPTEKSSSINFASPFRVAPQPRSASSSARRARVDVLYSEVVKSILQSRATPSTRRFKVAHEFEKITVEEKRGFQVEECFRVLKGIAHEDSNTPSLAEGIPPSTEMAITGVLRYLCGLFLERKLRGAIAAAPLVARRGGDPSILGDVRAYLNVIFERGIPHILEGGPTANGLPLWPQVYYLMRCGFPDAAADLAEQAKEQIEGEGGFFHHYIRQYVNSGDRRTVSSGSLGKLVQEYTVLVRRGSDPFRRVCYVLLARMDASGDDTMSLVEDDYHLLFNSIEDYLWLRLNLVREDSSGSGAASNTGKRLLLKKVQEEVLSFGSAHFDPKGDRSFQYVHVLLLSCQYKAALEYMSRSSSADLSDTAHLALAMYYYGLVDAGEAPLDEKESPRLDTLPELIWRYVKEFSRPYPREAAMYMFVFRDAILRHSLLRMLMLDTGEYDAVIGSTKPDAQGKGALDELWQYSGEPLESKNLLIASAAEAAENNGDRDAALALYTLCGEEERVSSILLHVLSAQLLGPNNDEKKKILRRAEEHKRTVQNSSGIIRDAKLERSFSTLLSLYKFFNLKEDGKFSQAWETIKQLNILPIRDDQLIQKAVEWKDGSRDLNEDVTDRIGDILVAAMECLAEMYSSERRRSRAQGGAEVRAEIKAYARVLVNFAGILQLPSDVSAKTIRIEVLMS
uniref:Nuclear pore protein n=2 Tax=Rhodosorus marinus TaxID=101924 RepID=A0A7S2ZLD0_9RHOD|mmetsp:Transcript_23893/g.94005  ORF Transcript_23893/g.94005 Transcript_23893/m.94005 type:complete len:729 (+) Transcript_23893:596-2782(+)